MFHLFKRKNISSSNSTIEMLTNMLNIFYSSSPIDLKIISDNLKIRSLLFTYGVIDAYCQAANLSEVNANNIFKEVSLFNKSIFGTELASIMKDQILDIVFKDRFLLDIITVGGKSYGDFLSGDKKLGGMSITRFGALITLWLNIEISTSEKLILEYL